MFVKRPLVNQCSLPQVT